MRIVIAIITALLTISAGAAFILWNRVLQWALDSLFPWVEVNIPTLAPIVREAFAILDNIGTPTRRTVKQSWEKVRQYLLKQVLQFERQSSDTWVRRVTSWLVPVLKSNEPVRKAKKVTTEEDVDCYDESMPPEVRQAFIRREEKMTEFDITKMQDEELAQDDDDLTYEN
ncbi:hypothetical protein [Planktothrix mougeotii]|uniref:Uncharacterized protein n=1 Tax=Planktothrix mougeotii LEGE 06226 TaxID=1828728 RepID=A0ABR9UH36_9CYAN|nr:hypothetical protein [Planktothrix mougeotii]MBE9145429.1 hypothetical protein [Planktothrix mougeotii LEGE 06226]